MKFLFTRLYFTLLNRRYLYWMIYTLFFGLIPILMRAVIACSVSVEHVLPLFVLSDFVFLGLMFNAVSMANLVARQVRSDILATAAMYISLLSTLLVIVFSVSLVGGLSDYITWSLVIIVLLPILMFSCFSLSQN